MEPEGKPSGILKTMCRESAVLLGFSAPQLPGQLTAGEASGCWGSGGRTHRRICLFSLLGPLLLPFEQSTLTRNESWDRVGHGRHTGPILQIWDKKDEFVGALEIGQHSSPHPGRYRTTNASFKRMQS
ncbi:hypothetical protein AMECASPLE_015818 [Ameca splendens]|uniref:Uncharacterized protein n=1 Tax=Ameca splendens TaxID=208324 RepID=A0ABV0YNY7_9TELE